MVYLFPSNPEKMAGPENAGLLLYLVVAAQAAAAIAAPPQFLAALELVYHCAFLRTRMSRFWGLSERWNLRE